MVPVPGSGPTIASIKPNEAAAMPRSGVLPESTATIEMPNTESASSSGEPTASTSGRSSGIDTAISAAPNSPPSSEDM
jgi:hypothetical protein